MYCGIALWGVRAGKRGGVDREDQSIPWRRYQEVGLGILKWTPDQFWRATPSDLSAAVDGYMEAIGPKSDSDLTTEDVVRLRTLISSNS
ncbi:MAG: phage tail assembly chaperone [Alphaproteobacteria bacterium]